MRQDRASTEQQLQDFPTGWTQTGPACCSCPAATVQHLPAVTHLVELLLEVQQHRKRSIITRCLPPQQSRGKLRCRAWLHAADSRLCLHHDFNQACRDMPFLTLTGPHLLKDLHWKDIEAFILLLPALKLLQNLRQYATLSAHLHVVLVLDLVSHRCGLKQLDTAVAQAWQASTLSTALHSAEAKQGGDI